VNAGGTRGTAFLIDPEGYLLTSADVVGSSQSVTISFSGGSAVQATVIGRDQVRDLAVLKTSAVQDVQALRLAGDPRTDPGTQVVSLGYVESIPPGSPPALMEGQILDTHDVAETSYVQTTTFLGGGFAGAPLLSSRGEVIGVMTGRVTDVLGEQSGGTGLAVNVLEVATRLDRLKAGAQYFKPTRPEDILPPGSGEIPLAPFPNFFSGVIQINGSLAPNGTEVYARIGEYVSAAVVVTDGRYSFLPVAPPIETGFAGEEITFYVDGFPAAQESVYTPDQADPVRALDLTATIPPTS
jgi:hypothetical protein